MIRLQRIPEMTWKVLWGLTISSLLLFSALAEARAEERAPAQVHAAVQLNTAAPATAASMAKAKSDTITLRDKVYYYQAFNQRDPFQSLIAGEFEESGELDIVDIYSVKLVGILSGGMEKFAMLEDNNGYAYIMKAGDPIRNGNIVSVSDRTLIARVSLFGQTSTVTLRLEEKKSKGE
jgi:Tfp pilus assembly protein PilP